jgi:hypothetical protein
MRAKANSPAIKGNNILAASEILLDVDENARQAVAVDARLVLEAIPRLLSMSARLNPPSGIISGAQLTNAARRASSS